jgi:hypothetical protein
MNPSTNIRVSPFQSAFQFRPVPVYTTRVETMTPDRARSLLDNPSRPQNRPITPSQVELIKTAVRRGEYRTHARDILLHYLSGVLLDGQHFCTAVVELGVPVNVKVTYGIEEDMLARDFNKPRSLADQLGFADGTPALTNRAFQGLLRAVFAMETGQNANSKITVGEAHERLATIGEEHLAAVVPYATRVRYSILAALAYLRPTNPAQIDRLAKITVGEVDPVTDTEIAFKGLSHKFKTTKVGGTYAEARLTVRGILAHLRGEKRKRLRIETEGTFLREGVVAAQDLRRRAGVAPFVWRATQS